MTGVEILSSETIYEIETLWWLVPLCAGIGLLIGLIIVIVDSVQYGLDDDGLTLILAFAIVGIITGIVGAGIFSHETDTVDHIEYKVTIDDSVSMNEFLDKYEILDQEGKIYTVKERE